MILFVGGRSPDCFWNIKMERKPILERIGLAPSFDNVEDKIIDNYGRRSLRLTYGVQVEDIGETIQLRDNKKSGKHDFYISTPEEIIRNRLEVKRDCPPGVKSWASNDLISSCGVAYHHQRGIGPGFKIMPHLFLYLNKKDFDIVDSEEAPHKRCILTPDAFFYNLHPSSKYTGRFNLKGDCENLFKNYATPREVETSFLLKVILGDKNEELAKKYLRMAHEWRSPRGKDMEWTKGEAMWFNFNFDGWKDYEVRFLTLGPTLGHFGQDTFTLSTSPSGLATVSTRFSIDDPETKRILLKKA